ncbi:putative thiol methyltransferase 2 [Wolffia australiana]
MASPQRHVVGVDKSETAVKRALERTSELLNKEYFTFEVADFFNWRPLELFDLIFDYTFFCAIDPSMRSAWGSQIGNLLKPDGELIALMFPVDKYEGGPPFAVSPDEYDKVLSPLGFKVVSVEDNDLAIEPRKGKEKLGRWKRNSLHAL